MRKLSLAIIVLLSVIFLVGCQDQKLSDNLTNVLFYTDRTATQVDTYFDVEIGGFIDEPEVPERIGFRFKGWFKDVDRTDEWIFETDTVTKTMVLFAKWEALIWNLEFILNEELLEVFSTNQEPPRNFSAGDSTALPDVRRPGGSFKGWAFVQQENYTPDMKVYRNVRDLHYTTEDGYTLYPIFNNNRYLVTFQTRNSEIPTPAPKTGVEYGSVINWLPTLPDTETQTFVGWYTKNGVNTGDWGIQLVNITYDVNGDPIELEDGIYDFFPNDSGTLLYARWANK